MRARTSADRGPLPQPPHPSGGGDGRARPRYDPTPAVHSDQISCQWSSTSADRGPSRYPIAKSLSRTAASGIHGATYIAGAAQLEDFFEYKPCVFVSASTFA